jgi:hypothetical protein
VAFFARPPAAQISLFAVRWGTFSGRWPGLSPCAAFLPASSIGSKRPAEVVRPAHSSTGMAGSSRLTRKDWQLFSDGRDPRERTPEPDYPDRGRRNPQLCFVGFFRRNRSRFSGVIKWNCGEAARIRSRYPVRRQALGRSRLSAGVIPVSLFEDARTRGRGLSLCGQGCAVGEPAAGAAALPKEIRTIKGKIGRW